MVLSRGLRDEVKTAFWGRAVDRQVVGLARGLAHHPTPACLQQLPTPSSAVRICSTLDRHTAVTEGHEQENPEFDFILDSTPFHEPPRFGQMGMARSTLARHKGNGSKPHSESQTPKHRTTGGFSTAVHPDGPCGSRGF